MTIKDRIKNLGNYFKEMQITSINGQQIIYVVVSFPNNWLIDENILEKYNVQVQEGTNRGDFYFCADIDTGEDAIFDAIEHNVNKMKSAIERANLLKAKIAELQSIFENEDISLEQLRTLTFSFPEKITNISDEIQEEFPKIILTNKKNRKKNNQNNDETIIEEKLEKENE